MGSKVMEIETFYGNGPVNLGWEISTFYPLLCVMSNALPEQGGVT